MMMMMLKTVGWSNPSPVPPGWRGKPLLPPVQTPWDLHRVVAGAHSATQPIRVVRGEQEQGRFAPPWIVFYGKNVSHELFATIVACMSEF